MTQLVIIVLAAAVVLFVLIMFVQKKRATVLNREYFKNKWQDIGQLVNQGESQWMPAIVEADKLLDEALKSLNFSGKTMGERLATASRSLTNPDVVWRAHKIRNMVVHESNVKLKKSHVSMALRGFRSGLKDLGAL